MSKKSSRSVGRCFIICLGFSMVTILVLTMILAWISISTDDPTGKIGIFSLIALIIAATISGLFASWQNPTDGVGFSVISGLGMTLIMLLCGIIASAGKLSGGAFMNYGCYLGTYALLSYIGMRAKDKRKRKARR